MQEAVWQSIQKRKTPYENKSFDHISKLRDNAFLLEQWKRYQPSTQMELPEFSIVIKRLLKFLQPVFNVIVRENAFSMSWSATQKVREI